MFFTFLSIALHQMSGFLPHRVCKPSQHASKLEQDENNKSLRTVTNLSLPDEEESPDDGLTLLRHKIRADFFRVSAIGMVVFLVTKTLNPFPHEAPLL